MDTSTGVRRVLIAAVVLAVSLVPMTVAVASPQWVAQDNARHRIAPLVHVTGGLPALASSTSPRHRPHGVWLLALERVQDVQNPMPSLLRPEPGVRPFGTHWAHTLTCGPVGGSHPQRIAACKQLALADGHIDTIDEGTGPCTDEYDPHIATAEGVFLGSPRQFRVQFPNRCEAVRQTGGVVFGWDA